MAQGTLTLTNGSLDVIGVGTKFTEYAEGSFITLTLTGVPYTIAIDTVQSDTALKLVVEFDGPTASGVAFEVSAVNTMALATMGVTTQAQRALRMLLSDQTNWRQIFSNEETITITMPNGQQITGMSWGYISQQLAGIDIDQIIALKNETVSARDDAVEAKVSAENSSVNASNSADASATSASDAAGSASAAAGSANQSADSAASAANSVSEASNEADRAEAAASTSSSEADRAEAAAESVDVAALLRKDDNLESLVDKAASRNNLDVYSKAEVDEKPSGGFLGQREWQELRTALEPGTAPMDGQVVSGTGQWAALYAKGVAGKLATTTEALWQSDPTKRSCYVVDTTAVTLRLPDANGAQPGSLRQPGMVGGDSSVSAGTIRSAALPNIVSETYGYSILGSLVSGEGGNVDGQNTKTNNALNVKRGTQAGAINNYGATVASASYGSNIELNLKRGSAVYTDGVTDVRNIAMVGCWTVRFGTSASHGADIDALQLATEIATVDSNAQAGINAVDARIDYALLDFGTMARSERKVLANPFGNNTPVEVIAEVRVTAPSGLQWGDPGWIFNPQTGSYGMKAGYLDGIGIVVQGGQQELCNVAINSGSPLQNATGTGTTSLPVRVHVRKVIA